MQFLDLPVEIVSHILALTLHAHPSPSHILTVHSSFHLIALPILHTSPAFKSFAQLEKFASPGSVQVSPHHHHHHHRQQQSIEDLPILSLTRVPDSVDVSLPGGLANVRLWSVLKRVLLRCRSGGYRRPFPMSGYDDDDEYMDDSCEVDVKSVRFTLNSLASDPTLHLLNETLATINPTSFTWAGPDPDHNFSCAIVPAATDQLFKGLTTWSRITHLSLSSISFSRCKGRSLLSLTPFTHPTLTHITLQQALFLHPSAIASCALQLHALHALVLIDVYQESIWGPRVRMGDVEAALRDGGGVDLELGVLEGLERIRQVVRCEAKRERLMGGDREMA